MVATLNNAMDNAHVTTERQARQSRPQLVVILADDSGSMNGAKATAATEGIRNLIMECQTRGPKGDNRSYFNLLLIRFAQSASIDPLCDMAPVRQIDPDRVEITGSGASTNITAALELAWSRLEPYMAGLASHPERSSHPLPLVLLFSDGQHNNGNPPGEIAAKIRSLALDDRSVPIACAGVAVNEYADGGEGNCNEGILREVASQGCYLRVTEPQKLSRFICGVGSSGASSAIELARGVGNV